VVLRVRFTPSTPICWVEMTVLDQPRKGCESEVLDVLLRAEIPRLLYVSCNPSSLGMSQKFSGFREDPGDAVKDLVRGRVF
jgi:hypothetical protein